MVHIKTLLPELRKLVGELAEDLLARSKNDGKIDAGLREAFHQIEEGGRTAQAYEVWLEDYLDQVAVAWVLACVFVRFMEDNHLIDECWLAGEGERRRLAEDTHTLFFREHAYDTDREYFQHVFKEVGKIPAAMDLFAEGKTPLWAVACSGDAAMMLLNFWREMDAETGHLKRSFQVESGDTRFLGDLYQELSERAKKKYALLQTPVFVEEFILDRTLTPALAEFGLEKVRMIDPTCGSGHFLLGGFSRLFQSRSRPEYTTGNAEKDAQQALDGVWGVDINPFAVAIARFRLIVAAVQACGIKRLKKAPGWNIHLASGDSLLFGSRPGFDGRRVSLSQQLNLFEVPAIYATEDRKALQEILGQGYHVVVGNPPYITVKDKAQSDAYRQLYSTCHRQYSLGVPFTQRFWELAIQKGECDAVAAGHVGMITANSYMKREFGKKLIEAFFPKVDLTNVIDTSKMGHTLTGHGTPTVILFGRNRKPISNNVRAVLGIKGEPTATPEGTPGFVWRSILKHVDVVDSQDEYTSTSDVPRATFSSHPWSIGGGGAAELRTRLEEAAECPLSDRIDLIGYICMTRADDVYFAPAAALKRFGLSDANMIQLVEGDAIRDWTLNDPNIAVFPYDSDLNPVEDHPKSPVIQFLWPYRTILWLRKEIGGTQKQLGMTWHEWNRFQRERFGLPWFLAFSFVATHNHFIVDRGGKAYKQSAPIIKLPAAATEESHLNLVGLLNSSTACFWMKQALHDKGGGGIGGGLATEQWEHFFEFAGTGLQGFPVPKLQPLALASKLDELGQEHARISPDVIARTGVVTAVKMSEARARATSVRGHMIALQEELDWHCYELYGLVPNDLRYNSNDVPELTLGQRAFEIVMARKMASGELKTTWFERHGSTPITEIPIHWPAAYRKLVEDRIKAIETNEDISLIEKSEFKRRWNDEPWQEKEHRAFKNWLLDRLETPKYRKGTMDNPELTTTAQMADVASADADFLQVAALYRGRSDFELAALVAELVEAEAVPFLPILRYKPTGLRKRELWERTWDLQRQQDELARQRAACDDRLREVRKRIEASFAGEKAALDKSDAEFRDRCIQARDLYAPTIKFKDDWDGSTMLEALGRHGVSIAGGPALEVLFETRKDLWRLRSEFESKVWMRGNEDAEYQAAKRERELIPNDPEIPVPPKYATADFLKTDYWRLRGKLDVPKERWVSYPHCLTDSDPTLVVGWAGWNHLEQATALVAYYDARKRESWDAKRLTPLLAGLNQLLPWIHQWHPEIDTEFAETAGQSFQTMLDSDAHELGLTLDDIRAWVPPAKAAGTKPRKTRTPRKKKNEVEDVE